MGKATSECDRCGQVDGSVAEVAEYGVRTCDQRVKYDAAHRLVSPILWRASRLCSGCVREWQAWRAKQRQWEEQRAAGLLGPAAPRRRQSAKPVEQLSLPLA